MVEGLGYLGAFIAGFLGTSSLFIAVFPSFLVVPILGACLNPVLVGVLAGIGSGIGQFLHYYLGYAGRYAASEELKMKLEGWRKRIDRYGTALIFAFAATPLSPDDVVWIPLGLMRYPKAKALASAVAGKIVLNLLYAFVGCYGLTYLLKFLG